MPLDTDKAHELSVCIEELCTSGEPHLNESKLRQLKRLCRLSDDYVLHCYHAVLLQLGKEHAEVRLSAFQIIEELFDRSHSFREALLQDFQRFLELTLETNPEKHLPPPRNAAKALKNSAYAAVKAWHKKFACGYKKLDIAYNFLKSCHQLDFNASEPVSAVQRRHDEEQRRRNEQQAQERIQKITSEAEEGMAELWTHLRELDQCLELLLPKEFTPNKNIPDGAAVQRVTLLETCDNADILRAFLEARKLAFDGKYPALLTRWLSVLQKSGGGAALLRKLIDLKGELQAVQARARCVRVKLLSHGSDDSDSEEENFIEVPMAVLSEVDYMLHKLQCPPHADGEGRSVQSGSNSATLQSSTRAAQDKDDAAHSGAQPKSVPTVAYDLDIAYWDDPGALRVPEMVPLDTPSRFWLPKDDSECSLPETAHEMYRARRIEFSGTFVPVERACGVRLPNGQLCSRMDRYKCPFHGRIVSRNPDGTVVDGEANADLNKARVPEWQDPAFLAEIKAATGLDLQIKKGKRAKKNESAKSSHSSKLTNIKTINATSRSRLERKILNKGAVRRVAEALDTLDDKRHKDKFSHTFVSTFSNH